MGGDTFIFNRLAKAFATVSFVLFALAAMPQATSISGIINIYTPVTAIDTSGCLSKVTVGSASGFAVGDSVLIIQMKGASFDSTNSASFGTVMNLKGAGNYEIACITAVNSNTITLNGDLVNVYYIPGLVQLVRIPCYTSAIVTNTLTCQAWNGSTGGVLIFSVQNSLQLNANIDGAGKGFRGGSVSMNPDGSCGSGSPDYYYDVNQGGGSWASGGAQKGEGIGTISSGKEAGKGPLVNGGGGGNKHNTGGGGGSNYTTGGKGGNELGGCPVTANGGLGGVALGSYYLNNKLFMGGGGGCGDENNGVGTSGANGGPIVIITASTISGNFVANANSGSVTAVAGAAADGAGGGGGGGAFFINATSVSISTSLTAFGGNGGNQMALGYCVGPGGGGGAGILLTSMPSLLAAAAPAGQAGIFLNNTCPPNPNYGATAGANNLTGFLYNRSLVYTPPGSASSTIAASANTVCTGQTLYLTATPGWGTYSWAGPGGYLSALQNPTISPATILQNGTYTLNAASSGSCPATATVFAGVLPGPTVAVTGETLCIGQTINVNATPVIGGTYSWSGPNGFTSSSQNFSIPNATTPMSGAYQLTVTGTQGCTSTAVANVVVSTVMIPTVSVNSPLCEGDSLGFSTTGSNAMTYTWTGPGAYYSNQQNPVIDPVALANSGTYTLLAYNGCTVSLTKTVTVYATPLISVSSASACNGQSLQVTASAPTATSFGWNGPNGFTSALPSFSFASTSPALSGAYVFTATSAQGCSNAAVANVSVISIPTPVLLSNQPVCEGDTLLFSTSGGANYTTMGPNSFLSTLPNPQINAITLAASGDYTLIASNSTCSASTVASVTIKPMPTPTASNSSPVCEPLGFQLNAGGGTGYAWTGPGGFSSAQPNPALSTSSPANAGTYSVTVTGTNGCQARAVTLVVIDPMPAALATGTSVCPGQSAQLTGSGGGTYAWSGPGGYASTGASVLISLVNPANDGIYQLLVTSAQGCTASASASLGIYSLPSPSISPIPLACINSTINLLGLGGTTYAWAGPAGFASYQQNNTIVISSAAAGGIYTLTVTSAQGCTASATAVVNLGEQPTAKLVGNIAGCAPFCPKLTLSSSGTASITSVSWQVSGQSFAGNTFSNCFQNAGNYTVASRFTDAIGCSNTTAFVVQVYPLPVADFEYKPLKPIADEDPIVFTNTSSGANVTQWGWYIDDGSEYESTSQNISYLFETAGSYPVALVAKNTRGCADTIIKVITVLEDFSIYVPNAFTPDGDNLNDVFQPKGSGIATYYLAVYNRWGEKLFETTAFEEAWDGTFKGKPCKEDVYEWKLSAAEVNGKKKELAGHVTLYR